MLYAVPQTSANSLELVKIVLQMIASQEQVNDALKTFIYDVIVEANSLSKQQDGNYSIPNHREAISLAVEILQQEDLAHLLETVTSKDMLNQNVANNALKHMAYYA
ncbi:hypothetical protein C3737_16015 [Aeromonas jandaei]|uniref:hypothetical protein n=1 Tax=Aeromonas TaxID=642 RepID=UPI0009BA3C6E|nr:MULTISPECIES: hypothetical protein [Aeromonas]ATP92091.1 hypothetical protein VI35_20295 [Aeromonas caviae]PPA28891.1 hypothetical protein C3737_16015 [Aeromonas jandaei]